MQRVLVYFLSNLFIFTSLTFTQDFSWNQSQKFIPLESIQWNHPNGFWHSSFQASLESNYFQTPFAPSGVVGAGGF